MEVWKQIEGHEGYEVSDAGRVRSFRVGSKLMWNVAPMVLKCGTGMGGYRRVKIDGKSHLVHRLVAEAFLGPAPDGRPQVAHWDGDPSNNRASNLRYASPSENNQDKLRHGRDLRGEHASFSKLREDDVRDILDRLGRGELQREIAADYGITQRHVSSIKLGQVWAHLDRDDQHAGL